MTPQPTIGRTVRYIIASGPNAGQARAAIITNILGDGISLTAFPDAANDRVGVTLSATNVKHSDNKEPGTWHWPQH
jgi:hypothetical protein